MVFLATLLQPARGFVLLLALPAMVAAASAAATEAGSAEAGFVEAGTAETGTVEAGAALMDPVAPPGPPSGPPLPNRRALHAAAGGAAIAGLASGECTDPPGGHAAAGLPTADLTCIRLYAAAIVPRARGRVRLLPGASPFGVSVSRDGVLRHRFTVEASGLPDPSTLGPYTRYVAWISPPALTPMIPLGEVTNGMSELDEGGFNSYLFLISAEGPEPVEERTGPLVLRGTSPTMVLRPHDLPYILAEMSGRLPEGAAASANPHAHHATEPVPEVDPDLEVPAEESPAAPHPESSPDSVRGHDAHGTPVAALPPPLARWRVPPMHPEVAMPAGMMTLRPGVSPFLPFENAGGEDASIPDARPREHLRMADGDTLILEAGPIFRRIGDVRVPGYGFNRQSPGPLIDAEEGSTIHVRFRNRTPLPAAIHWHGIRLDAPFDGVPGVTQDPVGIGADFDYELRLPDEGTFWYHPHLREDVMQDLGLAGNLRVQPRADGEGRLYAPVDREEFLVLDDHLVGPDGPVPYGREAPIHALMGRFGNVFLVNGEESWTLSARPGEVVRFHLTNVASTRTFNLSFGTLPMKLVASDVGKLPRELRVESVVVAPAERWVVDVRFPDAGDIPLENRVQALDHMGARFFPEFTTLGHVRVEGERAPADRTSEGERVEVAFSVLRESAAVGDEIDSLAGEFRNAPPDRTLVLGLRLSNLPFPLDPLVQWEGVYRPPVEWAGTMPDMDWLATGREVEWLLIDAATGRENMEIDWRFEVGERVKLRLVNDRDALHAMQHPIHLHGQRFLVLSVDGEPVAHPSWKDTVLVPVGTVVDLVVEMENPGPWMLHCHIAEHLETGMMTVIHVGS